MNKKSIEYLSQYINVTDEVKQEIAKHAEIYGLEEEICAWYKNLDDYFSDWCKKPISYTEEQATQLLFRKNGEFMMLPKKLGIVRFKI